MIAIRIALILMMTTVWTLGAMTQTKSIEGMVGKIEKGVQKNSASRLLKLVEEGDDMDAVQSGISEVLKGISGEIEFPIEEFDAVHYEYSIEKSGFALPQGNISITFAKDDLEFKLIANLVRVDERWYLMNGPVPSSVQEEICDCVERGEAYVELMQDLPESQADSLTEAYTPYFEECETIVDDLDEETLRSAVGHCSGEEVKPPVFAYRFLGELNVCTCADIVDELLLGSGDIDQITDDFGQEAMDYCEEVFMDAEDEGRGEALYSRIDSCRAIQGLDPLSLGEGLPEKEEEADYDMNAYTEKYNKLKSEVMDTLNANSIIGDKTVSEACACIGVVNELREEEKPVDPNHPFYACEEYLQSYMQQGSEKDIMLMQIVMEYCMMNETEEVDRE